VVVIGVEQGILLAIALSLLRHVRHSYRPHTSVLVEREGHWRPSRAVPGATSAPGLIVFQFGADLFYANASSFAQDLRELVNKAAPPIKWIVLDAGAMVNIDYSAARVVRDLQQELSTRGIVLLIVHAEASLLADMRRHHLTEAIGTDRIFDTLRDALTAINGQRIDAVTINNPGTRP